MKGIILAAGMGTRMGANTLGIGPDGKGVSKPLLPVFSKPTAYYALANFIAAGIDEVCFIVSPADLGNFKAVFGDGKSLGISITYLVQEEPKGIAEAFIIAKDFIGNDDVVLMLGDNVFVSESFDELLKQNLKPVGANIFTIYVHDPRPFGVVEIDKDGRATSLEEKPAQPKSHDAVVGVYVFTSEVVAIASRLTPSAREELEIVDAIKAYLERGLVKVTRLKRDTGWFDTGTPELLTEAWLRVQEVERKYDILVGSPEAAAYQAGRITAEQLLVHAKRLGKSDYGKALERLATTGW